MVVYPQAIVTSVEATITNRGPTRSARHHSLAVRPLYPRATTSATHAQINPSRRGNASAAQPRAISQPADVDGRAPANSSPVHSATAPPIAIADGLTTANAPHAIGVRATRMPAAPSGRSRATSHRAPATSAVAIAAPPTRAHQIGAGPGRRLSRPPGKWPQIGYSSALDGSVRISSDSSAAGAQLTGTAGWNA